MAEERVTLVSLCNGAGPELFDRELTRVIENIADANTNAKTARSITIKVTFMPDEDRSLAFAKLEVTSALAGVKPVSSAVYFGRQEGKLVAMSNNISQPSIFDTEKSSVVPLRALQGGNQ